ncbi:MAG: hypothetical protein IJP98_06135 [Clostridia bacterium]|nr:hypothetical protein [Clostridia bacterium]
MKHVFRVVGFLVVIAIIAGLALYTLNSFGYLRGPISTWINDVANHCQGVIVDTQQFLDDEGIHITIPTLEPSKTDSEASPEATPLLRTLLP